MHQSFPDISRHCLANRAQHIVQRFGAELGASFVERCETGAELGGGEQVEQCEHILERARQARLGQLEKPDVEYALQDDAVGNRRPPGAPDPEEHAFRVPFLVELLVAESKRGSGQRATTIYCSVKLPLGERVEPVVSGCG